jgi:acetoin utilization deacetylase AcuC-like enzyme
MLQCSASVFCAVQQNGRLTAFNGPLCLGLLGGCGRWTGAHNVRMQAFSSDTFVLPLPPGHRFPMHKYRLLREAVQAQLTGVRLQPAPAASDAVLALAHSPAYVQAVAQGLLSAAAQREIGFPWSAAMVERSRRSVGATLAAAEAALREGVAVNLAGGTHHAYADRGSGFCVFNDVAVAARHLQHQARAAGQPIPRLAVVDLDVHQGNGTASIFQGDDSVLTLSLHGQKNFPFRKEASWLDVDLPDGCEDLAYLQALDTALGHLAHEHSRQPFSLLFYLAGADPLACDRLGRLSLSPQGLAARDERVFEWARQRALPVAVSMAGGYGEPIELTVQAQTQTLKLAWRHWGQLQA